MKPKILMIDHYDSFTHNLMYYLKPYSPHIITIDEITSLTQKTLQGYSHLVLSPGYGHPKDASKTLRLLDKCYQDKKILGICLGHQIIAHFFGSKISKLPQPCHGKISKINILSGKLFTHLPSCFNIGRYHSLYVDKLAKNLHLCGATEDSTIMAFEHISLPIFGLQYHPESVLSDFGYEVLEQFCML